MPFKRSQNLRTLEMTSLIDIVFLLLIFFLVSFAFSVTGNVSDSTIYSDLNLPRTNLSQPVLQHDRLENLMIQIIPDTTTQVLTRKVFILWPSLHDTIKITRSAAYSKAIMDSTFAGFDSNFLQLDDEAFAALPASRLIANSITRFVELSKVSQRKIHPIVEVRAEANTEFKILNFIMNLCSKNEDLVPQIIIRTTP